MKRFFKFLLIGLAVLVLLALVFLTFFLTPTARYVINQQLPRLLGTEVRVDDLSMSLWGGRVDVHGMAIGQPEGFEGDRLVSLEQFTLRFSPRSLLGSRIRIDQIHLQSPAIHLIRDAKGRLNIEVLADHLASDEPREKTDEPGPLPGLWLRELEVRDLTVTIRDEADPEVTTTVQLSDFFFRLEDFEIGSADWSDLWDNAFTLASVEVSGARMAVERMAVAPLSEATEMDAGEAETRVEEEMDADEVEPAVDLAALGSIEPTPLPPFFLGQLRLHDLHLSYVDGSVNPEAPYTLAVELSEFKGTLLQSAAMNPELLAEGKLEGALMILQAHGHPVRIGLEARVEPVVGGIPTTAGFLRMTALDLLTFEPFLFPGIETTLGGSVFDVRADWRVTPSYLDVRAALLSHREVETRVRLRGTPDSPIISGSDIFLSILARPGQVLTNLAGDTLAMGLGIATGVGTSAADLAADAGRTVGRMGSGILGAGESLLRGDVRGAGTSLVEGASGAADTAVEGVVRAGEGVGSTASDAVGADRGGDQRLAFLESSPQRHQQRLEAAREWLVALPMTGWEEPKIEEVGADKGGTDTDETDSDESPAE